MTTPKRGATIHLASLWACQVLVANGTEPGGEVQWHYPQDCPALKQETKEQVEEFVACYYDERLIHSHPATTDFYCAQSYNQVRLHPSSSCQRERERLRGLLRHSMLTSPPNFDPKHCDQCRKIAAEVAPTER